MVNFHIQFEFVCMDMDFCLPSSCHKFTWHGVLAAWYDLHVTTCYILINMRGSLIRSPCDGAGIFPVRSNRWSWWQKLDRRRRRTTNPIIHHPFTGERLLVLLVLPVLVPELPAHKWDASLAISLPLKPAYDLYLIYKWSANDPQMICKWSTIDLQKGCCPQCFTPQVQDWQHNLL